MFVFDEKLSKVNFVLDLKNIDVLLLQEKTITFGRRTENMLQVFEVKHKSYTKEARGQLFYMQKVDEQLQMLFSYLSKKFLKLSSFIGPADALSKLINPLQLRISLLRHKQFKQSLLRFSKFVKDFSVADWRGNKPIYPNTLRLISLNKIESEVKRISSSDLKACEGKSVSTISSCNITTDQKQGEPLQSEGQCNTILRPSLRTVFEEDESIQRQRTDSLPLNIERADLALTKINGRNRAASEFPERKHLCNESTELKVIAEGTGLC